MKDVSMIVRTVPIMSVTEASICMRAPFCLRWLSPWSEIIKIENTRFEEHYTGRLQHPP